LKVLNQIHWGRIGSSMSKRGFLRKNLFYLRFKKGYHKVLGKGILPNQPVIVKAKFFSKAAEDKIKSVGGACILVA
jgi:ribosomal protein L15